MKHQKAKPNKGFFNKIYLDQIYKNSFERLAIMEGWITNKCETLGAVPIDPTKTLERNYYRSKTLLLLSLYESIDSDFSAFDLSSFVNEGIVKPNALMINDNYSSIGQ
ncbi:hypothetical protein KKHLCK_04585 [Candidatus Electrothrix laxa]